MLHNQEACDKEILNTLCNLFSIVNYYSLLLQQLPQYSSLSFYSFLSLTINIKSKCVPVSWNVVVFLCHLILLSVEKIISVWQIIHNTAYVHFTSCILTLAEVVIETISESFGVFQVSFQQPWEQQDSIRFTKGKKETINLYHVQ